MKKIIHSFDRNILRILTVFFLVLIPLYPKFPFIRINDTYISVRLEDFYVAFMALVMVVQIYRKKFVVQSTFAKYILLFWAACMASFLFNYFISHTIMFRNIGLAHTLRRVEYMIPFFVAYAAVAMEFAQTKLVGDQQYNQVRKYFKYALVVVFVVSLYALGQKFSSVFQPVRDFFQWGYEAKIAVLSPVSYFFFRFFDFPAVQTMNYEFAKGALLNLTPFARVSSTFAGHYDLAAYLVFFIPILASWIAVGRHRLRAFVTYSLAILVLIFTASRVSFAAYIVSIVVFCIASRQIKLLVFTTLLTLVLMYTNSDMTQRLQDTFKQRQVFENTRTGEVTIDQNLATDTLPSGIGVSINIKGTSKPISQDKAALVVLKNIRIEHEIDEARKGGVTLTRQQAEKIVGDKYKEMADIIVKSVYAGDTSMTTRTQVEWPRAWNAFLRNPLLGTGPSSITESTDGDYFRWLGETGLLGTGLFVYILWLVFSRSTRVAFSLKHSTRLLFLGFSVGMVALGINAVMIDVFEASKVAFTFWTMAGIVMAAADHHLHTQSRTV
ncbi:MAG: O-antigen ligase family protein [bacterium]